MATAAEDAIVLAQPFTLPCGVTVKNRLAKAPMTENLADPRLNLPDENVFRVYKRWAKGGLGMIITGNVPVDRKHMEAARNMALEARDEKHLDLYKQYAEACKQYGCLAVMQISHAGRQTPKPVNPTPLAPSNIKLSGAFGQFAATPRAMTTEDIYETRGKFIVTAKLAQKAGFDGVQIHSAHGYLLSEFMNPLVNVGRTDQYGGTLENRMRLLKEIVAGIRNACGSKFIISVKLNSSDFQAGGATEDDNLAVLKMLEAEKADFVEVSGGSYESPAMMGIGVRESTVKREAYFLDFAEKARKATKIPLMVTGGFRSRSGMAGALRAGATDFIGIGRPLCLHPEMPNALISPTDSSDWKVPESEIDWSKTAGESFWHSGQIIRMAAGLEPDPKMDTKFYMNVWAPRQLIFEPATSFPTNLIWNLIWPVTQAQVTFRTTLVGGIVAALVYRHYNQVENRNINSVMFQQTVINNPGQQSNILFQFSSSPRIQHQMASIIGKALRPRRQIVSSTRTIQRSLWTLERHSEGLLVDFHTHKLPTQSSFHYKWLRDTCQCPKCVHPDNRQKLHSSGDVGAATPSKLEVMDVHGGRTLVVDGGEQQISVKDDDAKLVITWNANSLRQDAGHESVFPISFLRKYKDAVIATPKTHPFATHTWTSSQYTNAPNTFIPYTSVMNTDQGLWQALDTIRKYGLVFIQGLPDQDLAVESLAEKFGCIRRTFYGKSWDVKSIPQARNIAYTSLYLGLHMDLLYFEAPPGLQFLHCLKNSVQGGTSIFVDAFKAVQELKETSPDAYNTLVNTPVTFHYDNDGHHLEYHHPTISIPSNPNTPVVDPLTVYYAPPFQGPLQIPGGLAAQAKFFTAFKEFEDILQRPDMVYERRLDPGDCVIFGNRRVLHGRTEFDSMTGERHLKGAYVDWDDFKDRTRVLDKLFS
ncbi:hypothetical protein SmJEL517_g01655 [Synchytrium microbalum]|uniref:TauD/TfdA-like domain-containing protein n=1 Tax=Synchytrium microbalum TaxID=1806994 RepID=A0A507C9K7_9FUNG|nr:uncharacterized protein SmJEL517_g01655 [Synchytrium microbalum]TPX36161.1 hypothetical protein SmJEL517_g01655 [Synchytrium microbalum]